MTSTTRSTDPEDAPPLVPGGRPMHTPAELPVEPDLGPVPPPARPEEPGAPQPVI